MNRLLKGYCVDVQYPQVSGAEHLHMLYVRDKLATLEPTLSPEELKALAEADSLLVKQAAEFYAELVRFIDLSEERHRREIPSFRWWWYLDVISQLPELVLAGAAASSSHA